MNFLPNHTMEKMDVCNVLRCLVNTLKVLRVQQKSVFESRIIQRMTWESMLLISPGIAPVTFYFDHTVLQASFSTGSKCVCTLGVRLVVSRIFITSWLCLFLISMSSHDESLAATMVYTITTSEE